MLVCCRRPSAGLRMHNRCCASAYQLLCKRISAVMQAHNSCCAAYGVNFSDNLYYLFRQLHLSFPTTSSVFCDCILRLRAFIEVVHVS